MQPKRRPLGRRQTGEVDGRSRLGTHHALRPPSALGHVLALRFSPQLPVTPGESTVAVPSRPLATFPLRYTISAKY
jgi:hypothetical protein